MTIQSPGDAASTACWMDRNWPGLPCQVPTVHTRGLGLCAAAAGAAAATPLRPNVSRAAPAAAPIRGHELARVVRPVVRPGDFDVGTAAHPLATSGRGHGAATRW